jgi:CDP-diacylglycerol--serine O-phosphatidyltransferase
MIGFYNYTVILTYVSLLISSVGIGFAVTGDPFTALFCLMASGVCDMFDGMIARTRKKSTEEEKRFGIQLDSLCDIVCFGVLPAAVGIALAEGQSTLLQAVSWGFGALFILGALIRLAYFNVTEETRQATEGGRRTHYMGVPVTTSAMIFPLVFALSLLLPAPLSLWIYPAFILITALAFITPVKIPKSHGKGLVVMGLIGLAEAALMFWLLLR